MAPTEFSSADFKQLGLVLKFGLAVVVAGWGIGSWWICCSSHALSVQHHPVFIEHEVIESLRGGGVGGVGRLGVMMPRELLAEGAHPPVPKPRPAPPGVSIGAAAAADVAEAAIAAQVVHGKLRGEAEAPAQKQQQKHKQKQQQEEEEEESAGVRSSAAATASTTKAAAIVAAASAVARESVSGHDDKARPTIFVSIAAYREQRGPRTIAGLFEKAAHPERIFVGLYQQWDPALDPDGTNFDAYCGAGAKTAGRHPLCDHQAQVSKVELHWTASEGPCVARANAEAMYTGQDFAMQIDSHSTFVEGWDEMLLRMWRQTKNEFAVLSGYPRSESELGRKSFNNIPMICTAHMLDWCVPPPFSLSLSCS